MNNYGIDAAAKVRGRNNISWLEKNDFYGFINLSKDASDRETDAFICEMFSYGNAVDPGINIGEGIKNALAKESIGVMGGGLLFYNGDKKIEPGCCCGIETLTRSIQAIENKTGAWLGHNPWPYFEYGENEFIVWSDAEELNELEKFAVCFDYEELPDLLNRARNNLYEFLNIKLKNRFIKFGLAENLTEEIIAALLNNYKFINAAA